MSHLLTQNIFLDVSRTTQETCPTYSHVPNKIVLVISCIFTQNVSHVPIIHTCHVFGVSHVPRIHTRNMPHILTHTQNSKIHAYLTYSHRTWVMSHILTNVPCFWYYSCPTYPPKNSVPHTCKHLFFGTVVCPWNLVIGLWYESRLTCSHRTWVMSHIPTHTSLFEWVMSHIFTQDMRHVPYTQTYIFVFAMAYMSNVPNTLTQYDFCMSHIPHIHTRYATYLKHSHITFFWRLCVRPKSHWVFVSVVFFCECIRTFFWRSSGWAVRVSDDLF